MRAMVPFGKMRQMAERVGFAKPDFQIGSIKVVRNPDPVLRYIAFSDESLWRVIERSELAVSTAKDHRIAALLGPGTEVKVGSSKSPAAFEYRGMVISMLKSMENWHQTLTMLCDPLYYGWRPYEVVWSPGARYNGREMWTISAIREKAPEEFAFTTDRRLVYVGSQGYTDGVVLDGPNDVMRWVWGTSGSSNNPYGNALYQKLYLIWYIKSRFLQMFSQGMERSMGMLSVKESGSVQAPGGGDRFTQLLSEVEEIRTILSQHNVLVQTADVMAELKSDVDFSEGWQKALEYLDTKLSLSITGQNLTMQVDNRGARAAAQVHADVLTNYAAMDSHIPGSIINEKIIPWFLGVNVAGEIAPEDMPRLSYLVAEPVTVEGARMLFDMGAVVDGGVLARRFNVPILKSESDKSDPDSIPLKTQEPPKTLAGGPAPTNSQDERNDKKAAEDQRRALSEPPPDLKPPAGAGAALAEYNRSLLESYLGSALDPFAAPPHGK